ncbi:MAG: transglycosylase SLT domain-containing protein [Thermoanaerobaculia bacterium]
MPTPPSAREVASEQFRKGKALALVGEADCARLEFQKAIETFRSGARSDDPDDAAFAEQLWQGVLFYDSLSDPQLSERPPVEDARDTLLATENAPAPTAAQVEKAKHEVTTAGARTTFDIPVVVNDPVLRAVAFYQFRSPQAFAGALKRSERYLPMMQAIFREEGLPEDLVYMSMVESAFKANAHSRARAHGFWQFIDGTARRYGLRKTYYVDERSDPEKSTRAAAHYLRDLYEMFGDWNLAMAAYDAGEGKILKGLQRLGATDYWQLSSGSFLRRETKEYVPFVHAAALISKAPASYGFDVVPDSPLRFEIVPLPRSVDLARVAEAIGASLSDLQLLNSELKSRVTPPGVVGYPLRVPEGSASLLAPRLASLPPAPTTRERKIVAKKGDTVAKVASRAGVTVEELCSANDLPRAARLRRGQVLVVPPRLLASKKSAPPESVVAAAPARHAGEIRALPTPAAAVTRAEEVPPFRAAPGSTSLAPSAPRPAGVEIPASGFETVPAARSSASTKTIRYKVRPGDTLYRIASKYGLTIDQIRLENGIGSAEALRAGSRLTLTLPLAIAQ